MNIIQRNLICLLSGCDYPIKPVSAFESCLKIHNSDEFITCYETSEMTSSKFQKRYKGFYIVKNKTEFLKKINYGITKIQRCFYNRKPYKNQPVFFGSQWWTLTYECIKYMLDFLNVNQGYMRSFHYTLLSDEMFFQTLIANSQFRNKITNNNLRLILFENNTPHPKVFTMADKDALIQSPAFFARKFDLQKDAEIIEFLKNHINE